MIPQVSIIIPCYNIARHIGNCIDSILAQSETDFELLLLNDGSRDDTLNIVQSYAKKDDRIRVFSHANQGVSFTRNRGIEEAKADWLLFIDGDDYVKPDYIAQHLAVAEESVWPISGMVNVKEGVEKENEYFKQLLALFPNKELRKQDVLKVLQHYSLSSPCVRLYHRKSLMDNTIRFDTQVSYQEDLLFNLQYIQVIESVRLIDYYGYYYVAHGDTSSSRYHAYFGQVKDLYALLKPYVGTLENELILQEFMFQTSMKEISNIMHPDALLTKKEQIKKLQALFQSDYFQFSKNYIASVKINLMLKTILRIGNSNLVYYYFKRLHN